MKYKCKKCDDEGFNLLGIWTHLVDYHKTPISLWSEYSEVVEK